VYVTDAGQSSHFHMCFDAAKEAGWVTSQRLDHVGFGVVQDSSGKRFKTRESETVKLLDLLTAATARMYTSLKERVEEGKSALTEEELLSCSRAIGYGAVKYFDLKNNPSTNYIFSYDRMLDTRGDTAVYLLFAYARVASIIRKAKDERGFDFILALSSSKEVIVIEHATERALAFELLQMGDMIRSVLVNLSPNKICDFLKELSVKFTDFVTQCHVLNASDVSVESEREERSISRLLLCEATRKVMEQCFFLLGITPCERI